ncbi:MAG TPA: UDP-N-acetylmuramoyl-tripeptide--D-alanyl-D-alanine ligase [Segeticoccus sp.]|uniref:UDP-N-acetylmuramoyl-tripeptide--D-alanyl-D- alanine ligase n=1 Tax=Segeticoccus sp. TaxID=2706531 RepID=UPI002D7E535C|nr:UDP-N-acetylmuramoyl-tripeptide--D-alanyl-D-alanine ligase [Segeticoccus sp.]HET8601885.1 UDP-N-acetylmuramoyl-tripeptide--D-alanyl-D-alanine ligase [Segeticoccus sp.]
MIPLQLSEIAAVTGGTLQGADVRVTSAVVTDSREASPGSLYVARLGEHADGHQFVGSAAEAGAVAALVSHPVAELPCVVVPDVQEGFARLARAVVDRAPQLSVVGITGSSGKTSTKDLLAAVLADVGQTVAPVGSYNSEVGVPLTVCRVTEDTRYLVAEMGADGVGHIAYLCRIAPPRIGVVLNVGSAHLGLFGSREAIAQTKGELVEALPPGGLAVLNADDPVVSAMAERTRARVVRVGTAADADVRASEVSLDPTGRPSFRLHTATGERQVRLGLFGEHQVGNALAVAAVALELGVDLDHVVEVFANARAASRWRMEVHERADGVTVVNDAYNANPESMRAALKALAAMGRGRRTWAVLGEMRELGEGSTAEHDAIGRLAVRLNIERLVAVGDGARAIDQGAKQEGSWGQESTWVTDVDAAYDLLGRELTAGDVVLLKSSRDSGLRHLGDRLVTGDADAGSGR